MTKLWWGIFLGALVGTILLAPDSNFANRVGQLFYILQESIRVVGTENPEFTKYAMMFLLFNFTAFILFNILFAFEKISIKQIIGLFVKFLLEVFEFIIGVLKNDLGILYINYLEISLIYIPISIFLINYLMSDKSPMSKIFLTTFIDSVLAWELLFIGLMFHSLAR